MLCFESEKMNWYYHVLARRPYLVVTSIAVYCVACIIVAFAMHDLPDFSDPTLGFETRGTEIGKRLTAWHNLLQESDSNGVLFSNPSDLLQKRKYEDSHELLHTTHRRRKNQRRKHKNKQRRKEQRARKQHEHQEMANKMLLFTKRLKATSIPLNDKWTGDSGVFRDYEITNESANSLLEPTKRSEQIEYGHNTTYVDEDAHRERVQTKKSTWRLLKQAALLPTNVWGQEGVHQPVEGFFCDSSPHKKYAHFMIQRIGPNSTDSLFDLNGLLAMCQLQEQLVAIPSYEAFCEPEMLTSSCCRPWSLPNYAALLANKSSCFDLTSADVNSMQSLLTTCYEYFHDLKLDNNCNEYNRCYAPEECTRHNLVFNVLYFLSDYNFFKVNETNVYLKNAMIFIPIVHSNRLLELFHEWENVALNNELVEVIAMDLGLENELFNELLLTDVWLVSLGGVFVMVCVWLYTGSAFITFMACFAICFSLGLAYFVYTVVFNLSFFPYMNLLAVVVIIGIGADDVFLFLKIWHCVLAERFTKISSTLNTQSTLPTPLEHETTETLENLMALTMRHAAASMFVTSLTTAAAFYASYSSSITAVKCFGIFAGTVVVTNYLLMITWLPASVSIMERLFASSMTCHQQLVHKLLLACKKSINRFCLYFEKVIEQLIMNYAQLWLFIFGALGISSAIIVFWYPGLQLPEESHFRLFVAHHPFEVYSRLKNNFWFEKPLQTYNFKMQMRFVWGVEAIDDGDYMNPNLYGNLYYDNNFNISTKNAQVWLLDFCQSMENQSFYQHTFVFLLPNCFIKNFVQFMTRRCIDDMDNARSDRTPCCEAEFPYEPHVFELCLPQCISNLYATRFFHPGIAGPKFAEPATSTINENFYEDYVDDNSNTTFVPAIVKALVVEFESNVSYSTKYQDIKNFYESVENWFQQRLRTAPMGLQNGWFISDLKFFNVQDTLSRDTLISITLAMGTSLLVLLFFTLNLLVSLYAVITVSFTIFNTVAVIILLGWKLNILESIAVSTAIGLAVDFSLHYGIHYKLSPAKDRIGATQFALSRIIGPTIMAAATTSFAGGIMMASNILPYIQIGIFLVVVMVISWFYATFFLMSMLKLGGPQYGFLQITWTKWRKRHNANVNKFYERKPSQVIASEQLLTPTSSAIVELANSETHELESLNSNSLIKTISGTDNNLAPLTLDFEHSFQTRSDCKYQTQLPQK